MQSNDEAAGDEEAADGLVELDDDKSDKGDDEGGEGQRVMVTLMVVMFVVVTFRKQKPCRKLVEQLECEVVH